MLRHFGFDVLQATDGQRGIALARDKQPDLILMDVSIPVVDGWEATRILKRDATTRAIPIIALTAHALAGDRDRAFAAGCDDYIPKPAEPRVVAEAVLRMLSRAEPASPS